MTVHTMLDLETYGTKAGCVIRSVGAVAFSLEGAIHSDFYRNVDEATCIEAGLTIEASAFEWWSRQSQQAQDALKVDPRPVRDVAMDFHKFFRESGAVYLWCHGANFDEPLWSAVARALNLTVPWKYWNVRCTRTLYHLANFDVRSVGREGTHHSALDDARHQVRCVQEAIARQFIAVA